MSLDVASEIGRLARVLVHRPGREIDHMVPSMMEHLLFDDILDGEEARQEHDTFTRLLRHLGVETLFVQDLLADVLGEAAAREELLADLERFRAVDLRALERLRELAPPELAEALVAGLRADGGSGAPDGDLFDLLPVPNYFFQRDPLSVVGGLAVTGAMATAAREREALLSRAIFRHHPALAAARPPLEVHVHSFPDVGPAHPAPTLEGGDLLVVDPKVLVVGISERTNRRGVEVLAEHLRRSDSSFRTLLAVELPPRRAFMHLDTVFTVIDRGLCLAYQPVIGARGVETARVHRVDLQGADLTFRVGGSLLALLAEEGVELELVPCGGADDYLEQQREQWTDGANAFAVAPGVIFLYERNRRTVEELAGRGWRVVGEDEALARGDLLDGTPTAITLAGRELSRARGGPRCMTMPLERLAP